MTSAVEQFIMQALGSDSAQDFSSINSEDEFQELAMRAAYVEGVLARYGSNNESDADSNDSTSSPIRPPSQITSKRVFVVHGHDGEVKETVARFLEKIGLVPVILHEQPNEGRTIIEKFEVSSDDAGFAVVLLTPDDVGGPTSQSPTKLNPRARQNVILELGYFMGRLGRARVCALHRGGVELPSDFQGILYVEFDAAGAWRTKLAQELVQAKLTIDIQGLMK
jgi:predicted nucleotide-binding protein